MVEDGGSFGVAATRGECFIAEAYSLRGELATAAVSFDGWKSLTRGNGVAG